MCIHSVCVYIYIDCSMSSKSPRHSDLPSCSQVLRELFANNTTLATYDLSGRWRSNVRHAGAGEQNYRLTRGFMAYIYRYCVRYVKYVIIFNM